MTVQESTICSLIQTFPVLLILAQNHNRCLKTPLIYKPPTPTHSPEYYEALDALLNNIMPHSHHGHEHGHGHDQGYHGIQHGYPAYDYGCQGQYGYGKKWDPHNQHQYPCYTYGYQLGGGGHTQHGYAGHGYQVYPHGYKKVNIYNVSGMHGYKGGYAPNQVYNLNQKNKIIIRRNKFGRPKKRSQKLREETCTTVDGGIGSCVTVFACDPYIKLLQQSRADPTLVQILRKAHCGFDGNDPKVCCPRQGFATEVPTPEPTTPSPPPPTPPPEPEEKEALTDFVFPEPPVCGFSNASLGRVVGGRPASLGDFPWMALLGYQGRRPGQATRWLCGGSLITSQHVLSAAHCVHGHESTLYVVRLGELDLSREDDGATPVDILIKNKVKHEQYSANAYTNDIAVLVLERQVEFTALISPICIPRAAELRAQTFERYTPITAGWGDLEFRGAPATHLQAVQLPVVTNGECATAYSAYKAQVIDERVLCAGYKQGKKDTCQGDSGGPLMQPIYSTEDYKTYFYQIGVVSFGRKCAEAGFPGVYSRVTHFVPWLEKTVQENV